MDENVPKLQFRRKLALNHFEIYMHVDGRGVLHGMAKMLRRAVDNRVIKGGSIRPRCCLGRGVLHGSTAWREIGA